MRYGTRENMCEMRSTRVLRWETLRERIRGWLDRGSSHRTQILCILRYRTNNTRRHCPDGQVIFIITQTFALFFLIHPRYGGQNFNLTTENHGKGLTADGFLDTREVGTITPFIEFPAESISLKLQEAKLPRSHGTMTARGMNMGNGGVDNC
jgi:hypothetical protein